MQEYSTYKKLQNTKTTEGQKCPGYHNTRCPLRWNLSLHNISQWLYPRDALVFKQIAGFLTAFMVNYNCVQRN